VVGGKRPPHADLQSEKKRSEKGVPEGNRPDVRAIVVIRVSFLDFFFVPPFFIFPS